MSTQEDLQDLLAVDVDDILVRAREFDSRTRFRLLRAAVEQYDALSKPIHRLKAVWLAQAILAVTDERHLPAATSSDVAAWLAAVVDSDREERDARRSALDSLALVFLKTKQLTAELDATIRAAFMTALGSRDPYLRDFANEALSGEGVLSRRSPGRAGIFRVSLPVDRSQFDRVLKRLRARARSRKRLPGGRKPVRASEASRRAHKTLD